MRVRAAGGDLSDAVFENDIVGVVEELAEDFAVLDGVAVIAGPIGPKQLPADDEDVIVVAIILGEFRVLEVEPMTVEAAV